MSPSHQTAAPTVEVAVSLPAAREGEQEVLHPGLLQRRVATSARHGGSTQESEKAGELGGPRPDADLGGAVQQPQGVDLRPRLSRACMAERRRSSAGGHCYVGPPGVGALLLT